MPASVKLTITQGDNPGKEFVFHERNKCIVGRNDDCHIQVVETAEPRWISRRHCLLDINPPDIRVRDLGSRSGTYINADLIGKRTTIEPSEASQLENRDYVLNDGDELRLHNTVLRVSIHSPMFCVTCGAEATVEGATSDESRMQCHNCRSNAETGSFQTREGASSKCCVKCGKDISNELGTYRLGEFVCKTCKSDPFGIIDVVLDKARKDRKELGAVKGYNIVDRLGQGGNGCVCLVKNEETRQYLALKVMLPDVAVDQRSIDSFLREVEYTRALKHNNIVEFYDAGCCDGTLYFTTEFCEVGSVANLIKVRGGALSIDESLDLTFQVLDGLAYAHQAEIPISNSENTRIARGVVHRDIKPNNVFLRRVAGRLVAKIGDYGLAKAFDFAGLSTNTLTGDVAGTPRFMSRQQVRDFKYSTPDVDVWAVAASLYNMLTGHCPRNFKSGTDKWLTVLQDPVVPIRERNPSLPEKLAVTIDAAVDDSGQLAFQTAAEFRTALQGSM